MRYNKIVISLLLLACPLMASAATYHVRTNGTASSCIQNTDTVAGSQNTIQKGLNCVTGPGDVVEVHGGTYGNPTFTEIPDTSGSNLGAGAITLRATTGDTVWLRGSLDMWNHSGQFWIIDGINIDGEFLQSTGRNPLLMNGNCRAQNMEVKNGWYYGISIGSGGPVFMTNIKTHDHGNNSNSCCMSASGCGGQCHGIYTHSGGGVFDRIESYNNFGYGLHADYSIGLGPNTFKNSNIHDNWRGIGFIQNDPGTMVYNTLIVNNTNIAPGSQGITYSGGIGYYNNTFVNNELSLSDPNNDLRNNIIVNSPINPSGSQTYQTNLCQNSGSTGCALQGDPGFKSPPAGDFHLNCAGCNSVGTGANLSSLFTTDKEGLQRPGGSTPWDLGAYVLSASQPPPNPTPGSIAALYTFEEGTGTTVNDTGVVTPANPGTWTECAGNACWTAGIVGNFAGNFNGSRSVTISNVTGLHPTGAIALAADIRMTTTGVSGCDVVSIGDSSKIHVEPNGQVSGTIYDGSDWHEPVSTTATALNGLNHFLGMSYDGTNIRVYLNGAQVAPAAPYSGLISYTLGQTVTIGRHGNNSPDYTCQGVIDQVYILDGFCDAACMTNLYNNQVSSPGLSIVHTGWFTTGASSTQLGVTDTDLPSQLITTPLALRFAVRKADAGSLTEYFKPMCITNTGAGFPPWSSAVELTNAFGAQGLRYYADATITQGQATSTLLPLEGFTAAAGKTLKNPIDTTSIDGYDPAQRATIAQGQQIELVYEVEFGSPLVGGNAVQCRLVRENGADLSNYANIKTVTLQGISPPTALSIGGIGQGDTQQ